MTQPEGVYEGYYRGTSGGCFCPIHIDHTAFGCERNRDSTLGTKNKNLKKGADGSLTLYVGAKSPGADKESNWLPAPNGHFSLYIRAYWGQQGILDGSWKPPVIRIVK